MALSMNEADIFGDEGMDELAGMSPEDIQRRSRLLENEIRVLKVFSAPGSWLDMYVSLRSCWGGVVAWGCVEV